MIRVCLHLCLCLGVQCVSEIVYVYVSVYQFVNVIPEINSGKLCMCISALRTSQIVIAYAT